MPLSDGALLVASFGEDNAFSAAALLAQATETIDASPDTLARIRTALLEKSRGDVGILHDEILRARGDYRHLLPSSKP